MSKRDIEFYIVDIFIAHNKNIIGFLNDLEDTI